MRLLTFARMLQRAPTARLARLFARLCVLRGEITQPRLFLRELLASIVMAELENREPHPFSRN